MTILECLNQLPDEMEMIDLVTLEESEKYTTVKELKKKPGLNQDGYQIYEYPTNYGRDKKIQIGVRNGNGDLIVLYRQKN